MAGYLRMQQGGLDPDSTVDEVTGSVYFHMWQNRQHPFSVLKDGDTIYAVEGKSRLILWEFRVANLHQARYDTQIDAFRQLDSSFGLSPADCNDYVWTRPSEGWLMAFGVDIISKLSIPLPSRFNFVELGGRNGWVSLDKVDQGLLDEMDLPLPGGRTVAAAADRNDPSNHGAARDPEHPDRVIPVGVRKLVLERDGRKCGMCGDDSKDMLVHFDHIYPWSKGGPNTAANLQILCSKCNLSKGAKILPGVDRPTDVIDVEDWRTELDLIRLLRSKSGDGDVTAAFELAGHVPDDEASDLLRMAMRSGDPDISALATAELAAIESARDNQKEATRLANAALAGGNRDAAAQAALILASAMPRDDSDRKALLERARSCEDPDFAAEAFLMLSSYEPGESDRYRSLLKEAIQCPDRNVRAAAALDLSHVAEDDERMALLYEAFGSSDDDVSESAMIGLAVEYYNQGWTGPVDALLTHSAKSETIEIAEEAKELLETLEL